MKTFMPSILTLLIILYGFEIYNNSKPKYDRDNWYHWNKNVSGCKNLRHVLLEKTSLEPVSFYSEKKCKVSYGKWYGPYTDTYFNHSSQLDIDHVVPLSWAASRGAINWSKKKKRQFANDIDNLIPVSRTENRKKGAFGLEKYLPPNKKFHCEYTSIFKNIVSKYELNYEYDEIILIEKLSNSCN